MKFPFKILYIKMFILNIFGEIKGGTPNLELEDVRFPSKNLFISIFILNIFGEIKGGDPKFGSWKGIYCIEIIFRSLVYTVSLHLLVWHSVVFYLCTYL